LHHEKLLQQLFNPPIKEKSQEWSSRSGTIVCDMQRPSDRFSIEVGFAFHAGWCLVYHEGERSLTLNLNKTIETETYINNGLKGWEHVDKETQVYFSKVLTWDAPHNKEVLTDEKREVIAKRVNHSLSLLGHSDVRII
jgi:hypothetical protein